MIRLDEQLVHQKLRLIVMDIEGAEVHALRGMRGLLSNVEYLYTEFSTSYLASFGESAISFVDELLPHFNSMQVCGDSGNQIIYKDRSWADYLKNLPKHENTQINLLFTNLQMPIEVVL